MNVDVTDRPAIRIAAFRHRGPYHRISEAFARLDPVAKQAGLVGRGASLIAVYHDDPGTTPESELRSDAGIMISSMTKVPPSLMEVKLGAGRYAHVTHAGPYDALGKAWMQLRKEWLPASGHKRAGGPAYEVYRNTPADTPPDELRTELYLPVV